MKIILVDKQEKVVAGMGVYSKELIEHLEHEGHTIVPLRFGQKSKDDPKNTVYLPYYVGDKSMYFLIPSEKTIGIINDTLEIEKPDIVHINLALSPLDFIIPKLCHQKNIPIIGLFHGAVDSRLTPFSIAIRTLLTTYTACFKQLDRIISFSESFKEVLGTLGIDRKRIDVLPNAVDSNKYSPGESTFKKENGNYILFLGRLDPIKNPILLIETFLKINGHPEQSEGSSEQRERLFNNLKLVIVGAGTQLTTIKERYGNNEKIIITGAITNLEKKLDIMRGAVCYVLPSTFEGLSLALLEAMSVGLPVIATDAGAHADVLADYPIMIKHEKVSRDLEKTLKKVLENEELQKEMSGKSRQTILDKYSFEAYDKEIIDIYKKTIQTAKVNPAKLINIDLKKNFPLTTEALKKLSSLARAIDKYFSE